MGGFLVGFTKNRGFGWSLLYSGTALFGTTKCRECPSLYIPGIEVCADWQFPSQLWELGLVVRWYTIQYFGNQFLQLIQLLFGMKGG